MDDAEELGSSNLSNSSTKAARLYSEATVPASKRFREGDPRRISPNSALELDCHVSSILNRLALEPRNLHQDFTEFLEHPIPDDAKLVHSVKGVWDDEKHRRKERGEKGPFEEPEPSASQRKYQQGETPEWAMSKHFRPIFESMLEDDRKRYMAHNPGKWPPDFRTFVTKPVWDQWIPTTFQSVESLFPSTMERDETLGRENPYGVWAAQGIGTANTSRAASAEPTGGVDAKALQELAKQVEQQEQSYTSSEQSDDDDRLIDPAQYHEDNASEADEENEPLVDDEDLDRAQLWGRDTSDHNTPVPDSDIDDRPPEPERQRSQKSLRELEAPVEASTGQDRILSDVAEDQTQREFPLRSVPIELHLLKTDSPTTQWYRLQYQ